MLIRMYEHKAVQEAGTERTFSPGVQYDVPPVVGAQWVKTGVAVEVAPVAVPVARDIKTKAGKERASA